MIDGQLRLKRKARFDKERHFYLLIQRRVISHRGGRICSLGAYVLALTLAKVTAVTKGGEYVILKPPVPFILSRGSSG